MNREIKFRAWLKDEKKMVEVDDINFVSELIYYTEDREVDGEIIDTLQAKFFKDIELMQYTGLKDKNGTKIFEGDIVKITIKGKTTVAQVKWLEKRCKFIFVCGEDWTGLEYFQIRNELEIIGNIYENPELLEKE